MEDALQRPENAHHEVRDQFADLVMQLMMLSIISPTPSVPNGSARFNGSAYTYAPWAVPRRDRRGPRRGSGGQSNQVTSRSLLMIQPNAFQPGVWMPHCIATGAETGIEHGIGSATTALPAPSVIAPSMKISGKFA